MKSSLCCRLAWSIVLVASFASLAPAEDGAVASSGKFTAVTDHLRRMIAYEREDKRIPAIAIALVDDQQVVWAEAFGLADPQANKPATADTVFRVGSVSKLFTDLAVMQLVEQGQLDLDAPIETYLPDFQPKNPFGKPITLRQLMSHRAGLVREPPVGNYFDPAPATLAETVRSLNGTSLVYEPGTHTKYSNAAIATVGYVLERTQGKPFAEYLSSTLLTPLEMKDSSFEPSDALLKRTAKASMWTYDGRTFDAPTFPLGMAPAGSMYTTVRDLGKFVSMLLADGRGPSGQVVKPETIAAMWKPVVEAAPGKPTFGIGFRLSTLAGRQRVGHGGAIYGFATEFAVLPNEKLGVAVVATLDCANDVVERIADRALEAMLAAREMKPLPRLATSGPVDAARIAQLRGRYIDGTSVVRLEERGGQLFVERGATANRLRQYDDTLVVDDALVQGMTIRPLGDRLAIDGRLAARAQDRRPDDIPARWRGLIGEYGWDHNTLYILERDGRLNALIEWFYQYPLEEISENVFAFPHEGLYTGEQLVFTRDASGSATGVVAASVPFQRRPVGTPAGETFKIAPRKPVEQLRADALAAKPPAESGEFVSADLVELAPLDPTIKHDVRYATTNNFLSTVFYTQPRAFLQRPAAEALLRAHRALKAHGYGLLIHDAYRPWYVTKMFWDATSDEFRHFVADPNKGSRHNRGCAVDLTLYELATGKPVEMPGGYDEFSTRSYPHYPGGTSLARWQRELLRSSMEAEGFKVYEFEWWHFDYQDWQKYRVMNKRFEDLGTKSR